MNPRKKSLLRGKQLRQRFFPVVLLGLSLSCTEGWLRAEGQDSSNLTVHEWGTFTAIAGKNGQAVEWTPLTGPSDLPGFVEHFSYANFKLGLRGTIRMETPVVYFYSPRDVTVSVRVAFSKGILTEWYPRATHVQPSGVLRNTGLNQVQAPGTIAWNDIAISPDLVGDFPYEAQPNRYYAARETASSPIRVKTPEGDQLEKFLFYRGVSASQLPLSARLNTDGKLFIKNLGQEQIPAVILFERRGENIGYSLTSALMESSVLDAPKLTSTVDTLCEELEGILVVEGLYPDEAHAMVATWRDSWLEEGCRLIYVVPRGFIDNVLPLTIDPEPAQMVRVFVGRLEIVTATTARAIEDAVFFGDDVTLNKYGRFLEPILRMVSENHTELVQQNRLDRRPAQ